MTVRGIGTVQMLASSIAMVALGLAVSGCPSDMDSCASAESPYDGIDNDCDPATPDDDLDGDGHLAVTDCDDSDPAVHPGREEVPSNGIDDDCDPATPDKGPTYCDGLKPDCTTHQGPQGIDRDGDGWGECCDCDETDPNVHPYRSEIADNGIDDDCNPRTPDDGSLPCDIPNPDCSAPGREQGADSDGDGWGECCDCNEQNQAIHPGRPEVWGNGLDDDCDPRTLDAGTYLCDQSFPDCSQEGLPGQGPDMDGDLWGECCDCDDSDELVHPQASEVIFNGKDDDCDPRTLDQDGECNPLDPGRSGPDYDGDGWGAYCDCDETDWKVNPGGHEICSDGVDQDCNGRDLDCNCTDTDHDGFYERSCGGDDCIDINSSVHPGAEEICDGLDNDCDGSGDPNSCNTDCPDMSGTYDVWEMCLGLHDFLGVEVTQDGCSIFFHLDATFCSGRIDNSLILDVLCAGLGYEPCTAQVSLTHPFRLVCSEQCSFQFNDLAEPVACTHHSDPVCTQAGALCGAKPVNDAPMNACVVANPGGRDPGYYCDEELGILCDNSMCVNNSCAAPCSEQSQCEVFPGTTCQAAVYDDYPYMYGEVQICAPEIAGETRCDATAACPYDRVCSFRQTDDQVLAICRQPNQEGGLPGISCLSGSNCMTNLCACPDGLCDGSQAGICSEICVDTADCVQGSKCERVSLPDLSGDAHSLRACVPDPDSCARNADCPEGRSCQVLVAPSGLSLSTECLSGSGPGGDNTGQPCSSQNDCYSVWCDFYQNYCVGTCIDDADCPDFQDGPTDCSDDSQCSQEELCDDGHCLRPFECATTVFLMGFDAQGEDVYDTVRLCRPERRPCSLDADCRPGESCQLQFDATATGAGFICGPGHGPGQLGQSCYFDGASSCWTGLCLRVDGGGPGNEYCSKACAEPADCGAVDEWTCRPMRFDIRPGYSSYLPVCVRI